MSKTALIFYGMIRNFGIPSKSIKKHIIHPNNADVYFFGPSYTDKPANSHYGEFDRNGHLIKNPKSQKSITYQADLSGFVENYKKYIKIYQTHDLDFSFFEKEAQSISGSYDWLFNLNPARILSMFYNINGAIKTFINHANKNSIHYDYCILTRPDLVFYNSINSIPKENSVHIPKAQGFNEIGEPYTGNAPVYFYKNARTGEYIPGGRHETFNDQFLIIPINDIVKFQNIYSEIKQMITRKVPLSPETLFYLFVKNNNLKIIQEENWFYEIFRGDTPIIKNVIDSEELKDIDPYHPSLSKETFNIL